MSNPSPSPKSPAQPIFVAAYGDGVDAPPPPPTNAQVMAVINKAKSELPEPWSTYVELLGRRVIFERSLLAQAADFIPADATAEDDPQAPPAWVVYVGDALRAAGRAKSVADRPHWALTADPHDPAAREACDTARVGAMARGLERAFLERLTLRIADLPTTQEREDATIGGMLTFWPRLEDDTTLDESVPVGIAEGAITVPTASRLEKEGLVTWKQGRAHITERGQRAGQLHSRLNSAVMAEVQAEAAETLAGREV